MEEILQKGKLALQSIQTSMNNDKLPYLPAFES